MKKTLTLCLLLSAFFIASAQDDPKPHGSDSKPADVLQLKETEFDFGKIPQGKPVYHIFEIVNTGSQPLKLDNVQASCGCTTPEWSRDPIAAGATAQIRVGYNAAAEGNFDKFITITYNGNQTKQLRIKGNVWKAPDGAAPSNGSVQFLKSQQPL
jgi:Protein of unknown function (DUF1573)